MPKFSTDTLTRALDSEVADWSSRGYRVVTRSATSAQLSRPKAPVAFWIVAWLIVCSAVLGTWAAGMFGPASITTTVLLVAGGVFAIGLVLIIAMYSGVREPLVYLNIGQDGGIVQR